MKLFDIGEPVKIIFRTTKHADGIKGAVKYVIGWVEVGTNDDGTQFIGVNYKKNYKKTTLNMENFIRIEKI